MPWLTSMSDPFRTALPASDLRGSSTRTEFSASFLGKIQRLACALQGCGGPGLPGCHHLSPLVLVEEGF